LHRLRAGGCLLKTLRKSDALQPSMDGNFAGNGLVSTKLSAPVRRSQGVAQGQLYILAGGIAGTGIRRGDPAISLRSSARSKGWTRYSRLKLRVSHDPARMEREIGLCVWDCEIGYRLCLRLRPCFSAEVQRTGTGPKLINLWKMRHHKRIRLLSLNGRGNSASSSVRKQPDVPCLSTGRRFQLVRALRPSRVHSWSAEAAGVLPECLMDSSYSTR
jgi:hypothetical protein